MAASEVESGKLKRTIWRNKDPSSRAHFVNYESIWKWFANHGVRTPLIIDDSIAIYAEDTDIDASYLCKLEAKKEKRLTNILVSISLL